MLWSGSLSCILKRLSGLAIRIFLIVIFLAHDLSYIWMSVYSKSVSFDYTCYWIVCCSSHKNSHCDCLIFYSDIIAYSNKSFYHVKNIHNLKKKNISKSGWLSLWKFISLSQSIEVFLLVVLKKAPYCRILKRVLIKLEINSLVYFNSHPSVKVPVVEMFFDIFINFSSIMIRKDR